MNYLFGFNHPDGGMGDYIDGFDTIEAAKERAEAEQCLFYDIAVEREGDYIIPAKLVAIESGKGTWVAADKFVISWEKVNEPA